MLFSRCTSKIRITITDNGLEQEEDFKAMVSLSVHSNNPCSPTLPHPQAQSMPESAWRD